MRKFSMALSALVVLVLILSQVETFAATESQGAALANPESSAKPAAQKAKAKRRKKKRSAATSTFYPITALPVQQTAPLEPALVVGSVAQPVSANVETVPAVGSSKGTTNQEKAPGVHILPVRLPLPVVLPLQTATAGQIIISEFRYRGPAPALTSASDEFIELYNASGADHTVTAASGTGYGVAASDGTTRCTIPNGTVIPNRGHYLCVNSVGYSLGAYATGDATYVTDIPDNVGIALFNNNTGGASYSLANRLDAVGSTGEANVVYKEGTGYPNLTPFDINYSFYRDNCGKQGSITTLGACPSGGLPVDTDNNATNFVFVDTNGTSAGAGQRLGAPGPENLSSPINRNGLITANLLDSTVAAPNPPNRVRDFTSDMANNSTFGTLSIRRRFVNNTGANVTRLRFRIVDQTTFPAPSGFADLRSRTSSLVVVAGINDAATCTATGAPATPPCTVSVQGTTLETPPSQLNGGAFNSSMAAGTVTLGTPPANGASINLQFLLGIQQTGTFKFFVNVEALP